MGLWKVYATLLFALMMAVSSSCTLDSAGIHNNITAPEKWQRLAEGESVAAHKWTKNCTTKATATDASGGQGHTDAIAISFRRCCSANGSITVADSSCWTTQSW